MLTPRPYQLEGRDFLAGKRIALLADEMRVGKTPQAIMAAHAVGARSVLVICPAIAVPMWRHAFPTWYTALGASLLPQLTVLSFEKARLNAAAVRELHCDVAIIDECHFAGNPDAQRTKLIYGKGGIAWTSGHTWALSGTPAPKHAGSLWPLLRCAGVVGMDYDTFLRRYCRIDFLSQRPVGTREEMIPELRALWQQIGLRRTRKEVAPEMPDIAFEFLPVDVKADLSEDLRNISDDALEAAANVDSDDRKDVAMAKAGPLLEEIEFDLGSNLLKQTVVFGWHIEPLQKITASLNAMGFKAEMLYGETSEKKRVEIQERFRLGLLDVVVGQIRACGTAIDLSAASHGYFLELDWVPANNMQAANRLVAIGKYEPVTIDVATMPGSVDDRVQRVLIRRAREINALI